ncbi:MAPEG family protein [Parvularcula sp. LCG005]|uniref:MAPEG family protein n=1 Tax=Parvularcula sp. LCG005 TaxID=3078805 RepID=UPI00294321C9|nr:MAPEG family protein [Parvularcula sp. LCG005]WOI54419.1 MAPEG family protein [Parvularcula sp. LCG005]
MPIELATIAFLSCLLLLLTFLQGFAVPFSQGLRWGLGSRDTEVPDIAIQARLRRTVANHIECMAIAVPLLGLVQYLGVTNGLTELAAWLIIGGRTAFAIIYLAGIPVLRTVAWATSIIGILLLISSIL